MNQRGVLNGIALLALVGLDGRPALVRQDRTLATRMPAAVAAPGLTAFVDVTVLPMDRPSLPRVLRHQTVLVRGERIVTLGPTARVPVPPDATVVDGRGRYLMPGLGNMHTHIQDQPAIDSVLPQPLIERMLLSYLAEGITTVRNMNGRPWHVALREQVARGELLGPRIYTAGPVLFPGETKDVALATPVEAVKTVVAQHAAGYDFLKIYGWGGPQAAAIFDSLVAASARVGMPLAGHVPEAVGLDRMLAAHVASTEHLYGYLESLAVAPDRRWVTTDRQGRLDAATLTRVAQATRRARVWTCPTLSVLYDTYPRTTAPQRLVQALHEAGAGLLLGTDGGPLMQHVPIATELQAFVTAGLTPYQALETGTRNVAAYFGTLDSVGTVTVGKRADLVLLAGNPLEDVRRVADPVGVMVGGHWLPRTELAARLRRVSGPAGDTLVGPLAVAPALASAAAPLVLRGVTVIDVRTGRHLPNRTVVIAGTKIRAIGRTEQVRVPPAARVVEAKGKYLIPGLWDLHVHPHQYVDVAYPLFLANGVTGVRDAGSSVPLATLTQWKGEIARGGRVGPRLLVSGPSIDSPEAFGPNGKEIDTVNVQQSAAAMHHILVPLAAARRVVDSLHTAGADLLKIYAPTRALRLALIAEAKRVGIRFGGHAWEGMWGPEFSDSGATLIDHTLSLPNVGLCGENATEDQPLAGFDGPRCAAVVQRFWQNHTWIPVTAGLAFAERQAARRRRYEPDAATYAQMWREIVQQYPGLRGDTARLDSVAAAMEPISGAAWEQLITAKAQENSFNAEFASDKGRPLVDSLHKYHIRVPVVLGTDAWFGPSAWQGPLPGFAVHDLLFLLGRRQRTQAGIALYVQPTPLAALQTATLNPALALGATDSMGTVEVGKLADLVLLDADPLQDIWNTTTIRAVVANGRYYDRAALDELLRVAERAATAYRAAPRQP